MNSMTSRRTRLTYRVLSAFIAFTFSFTSVIPPSYAQSIASLNLPVPGAMVVHSAAFVPVLLKGMTVHLDNPLQFDFIIDSGNTDFKEDQIKTESERLVKYFLASMTIPKDDLWVNLSPYESDKIIPEVLGKTELGRDMLAQDYILKQLTASLMYPEKELGKEFWDKVYKKAQEKYGTTEIPVDTFNKVWILPETATVYEHGQTVYIVEARLKVMLDSDYLAMSHNVTTSQSHKDGTGDVVTGDLVTPQVIREIILPEIEREVNEGQNFAPLRQIYHSLILAKWYKETIKNSLLSKIYVDQKKIAGVNLDDATLKDQIYARYMEAYKKGVFNYIKEDYDQLSAQPIPRKYFSGGEFLRDINVKPETSFAAIRNEVSKADNLLSVRMLPQKDGTSLKKGKSDQRLFFGNRENVGDEPKDIDSKNSFSSSPIDADSKKIHESLKDIEQLPRTISAIFSTAFSKTVESQGGRNNVIESVVVISSLLAGVVLIAILAQIVPWFITMFLVSTWLIIAGNLGQEIFEFFLEWIIIYPIRIVREAINYVKGHSLEDKIISWSNKGDDNSISNLIDIFKSKNKSPYFYYNGHLAIEKLIQFENGYIIDRLVGALTKNQDEEFQRIAAQCFF